MRQLVLAFLAFLLATGITPDKSMAYGALAISNSGGHAASNCCYETASAAQTEALVDCRRGGYTCRVVATFQHQCVGIAGGVDPAVPISWVVVRDRGAASRLALAKCRQRDSRCQLLGVKCDH